MRRFPAILLLALFSVSLIPPTLFAGVDSKLPACCRRDGMHHCATGATSSTGPVIQAVCTVYPQSGAAPASLKIAATCLAEAVAAPIAPLSIVRARTVALAHVSFSRTRQKRGPPTLTL